VAGNTANSTVIAETGRGHHRSGTETSEGIEVRPPAQSINYLKAIALCVCLLLDFGKLQLEIQRMAN
jgi:hypothetical protein